MLKKNIILSSFITTILAISGCSSDGVSTGEAVAIGAGLVTASLLDKSDIKEIASQAAKKMDSEHELASSGSQYHTRLQRLIASIENRDKYNFKVYQSEKINAFAMADGTIRVYSGLMDIMSDAELLAVIQHEIGHVERQHVYEQTKEMLYTDAAFKAVIAAGGTVGELTQSQLGQLAYKAVNAHFSQKDELEADAYAVKSLAHMNHDPVAMKNSIKALQEHSGGGGGFLSSHPSSEERITQIEQQIARLKQ